MNKQTKPKESLNNRNERDKLMEEIDLKDWKPLKYFAEHKRWQIQRDKENGDYKIKKDIEDKLMSKGWIDFDSKSKKLHDEEFVLTKDGHSYFHKLKEIYQKDWGHLGTIINIILGIFNIYLLGKSLGWW